MAGSDTTDFKLEQVGVNATILAELKSINAKCDRIEQAQTENHKEIEGIKIDLATRPCEEDWKGMDKRVGEVEKKVYAFSLVMLVLNAILGLVLKYIL